MPHSSPGSRTTSLSRASVLSASSPVTELGSGTCLTVTTIFTSKPAVGGKDESIIDMTQFSTKTLVVLGRVQVAEEVGVKAFQPGDVEVLGEVGGPVPAGVK